VADEGLSPLQPVTLDDLSAKPDKLHNWLSRLRSHGSKSSQQIYMESIDIISRFQSLSNLAQHQLT